MIEVTLSLRRDDVFNEVAKTTSYIGAKMDDENAYDRIFTTDEDRGMLQRFWDECRAAFCNLAKRLIAEETDDGDTFTARLELSAAFQPALTGSIQDSLFSFFVTGITSKWNAFCNKDETAGYGSEAQAHLDDAMRKLLYNKRPQRPTY